MSAATIGCRWRTLVPSTMVLLLLMGGCGDLPDNSGSGVSSAPRVGSCDGSPVVERSPSDRSVRSYGKSTPEVADSLFDRAGDEYDETFVDSTGWSVPVKPGELEALRSRSDVDSPIDFVEGAIMTADCVKVEVVTRVIDDVSLLVYAAFEGGQSMTAMNASQLQSVVGSQVFVNRADKRGLVTVGVIAPTGSDPTVSSEAKSEIATDKLELSRYGVTLTLLTARAEVPVEITAIAVDGEERAVADSGDTFELLVHRYAQS